MGNRSMFVGMDVHKETIDISVAEGGRQGEVRHDGVIAPDLEALDKVVRRISRSPALRSCIDAAESEERRAANARVGDRTTQTKPT